MPIFGSMKTIDPYIKTMARLCLRNSKLTVGFMYRCCMLSTLLCLLSGLVFSQNVRIEFAIHYETMYNDFLDTITEVPFLDVTYTNDTNIDIFIKGVSDVQWPYPKFRKGTAMGIPYEVYKSSDYHKIMAFNKSDYAEDFVVELDGTWTVLDSMQVDENEVFLHYINDDLSYMYDWKELDDMKKTGMPRAEEIWQAMKNNTGLNLVFLKSGTSYVTSHNLMALCINRGKFLFRVSPRYTANSVVESCWNMAEGCFVQMEWLLPDTIQQYHRYNGEIKTNECLLEMK